MRQRLRAYCKRFHAYQQKARQTATAEGQGEGDEWPEPPFLFFLEQQPRIASRPRYWRLDPRQPLEEGLKGKVIVEFPRIHVTLPQHAPCFPLAIEEVGEGALVAGTAVPMTTTGRDDSSSGGGGSSESDGSNEESSSEEEEDAPGLARLTVNERLDGGIGGGGALAALLQMYNDDDGDEEEDEEED